MLFVGRGERSTVQHIDAEHRHQLPRRHRCLDLLRLALTKKGGAVHGLKRVGGDSFETGGAGPPVHKIKIRCLCRLKIRTGLGNIHEPFGSCEWQRPGEYGVNQTEHRGISPDAKCYGQDRRRGETSPAPHGAKCVFEIESEHCCWSSSCPVMHVYNLALNHPSRQSDWARLVRHRSVLLVQNGNERSLPSSVCAGPEYNYRIRFSITFMQ